MSWTSIAANATRHIFTGSAALLLTGATALAQSTSSPERGTGYYNGPDMYWGSHMGGYGMIFGPLFMLVFIAAIIFIIFAIMRWMGGTSSGRSSEKTNAALDILKSRFARGEIDAKEFEERKHLLSD